MYEKFGKSYKDIADLKVSFFKDNCRHLDRSLKFARLYTSQPPRTSCKICEAVLPEQASFVKHEVPYVVCGTCGQLNGMHEDSDSFCRAVYTSSGGESYAENYSSADVQAYEKRREAIYTPKAEFLLDVLGRCGESPTELTYADMGAGAGYFVSAMMELGAPNISGYEVGKSQVDLGNWIMPSAPLQLIDLHETESLTKQLPADVLTFIGVFEHLQNPRSILAALNMNQKARYLYFCVPLFGPTVYNEMAFPQVMPRQLAIGHTHLFTPSSIEYLSKEFGLEPVGAWWFGTDVMDYFRSIQVSLLEDGGLSGMAESWTKMFEGLIDDLQLVMDRKRQCSQVHMAFRVNR